MSEKVVKIEGIILSEKSYGETSKILNILTKEKGIIGVMSKGCKRIKSPLRSVSSVFTYAIFSLNYKEDKLSTLISADVINPLLNIRKDINKISYLNFICELSNQVIKQTQSNKVYELLINSVIKIEEGFDPLVITNILELKYLNFLGIEPNLDGCTVCGTQNVITLSTSSGGFVCLKHLNNEYIVSNKTIKIIRMLKYVDVSKISKINIKDDVKKEINDFLDEYYDKYTGLYLKSKKFIEKLVNL